MDTPQINLLRYAVIGVGASVFSMHRDALQLPGIQLIAVSDVNTHIGRQRADELGSRFYADYRQLLADEQPDVTVILTPHPLHARIAIDCLQAGSHVLVEKPIAVQVAEADAMIQASERYQRLLGVIFQNRFRPDIRAVRTLIQEGRLGDIQQVDMNMIWTRTASYYRTASWRGTWAGEGGGVLMNQAPHHLDLLCHLVGLPTRVFGWTRRQLHQIETEDTVQASLEWSNGALGSLHISTAEAGPAEFLRILGTRGWLEFRDNKLSCWELESDLRDFIASEPESFAKPKAHEVTLTLEPGAGNHQAVYRAFQRAVLGLEAFTSTGDEGRMSLELANALIYSNYTATIVELPLDRQKYATLLEQLREQA